eukprot:gb/GEZN01016454.1/.p1 GENE.gb/GEZN01016454.1/~~gb/GEZN01016454.1/.p1  ORF type:complete len:257 (+),score=12.26 gb/GEZN01016454.1/:37-807(+)
MELLLDRSLLLASVVVWGIFFNIVFKVLSNTSPAWRSCYITIIHSIMFQFLSVWTLWTSSTTLTTICLAATVGFRLVDCLFCIHHELGAPIALTWHGTYLYAIYYCQLREEALFPLLLLWLLLMELCMPFACIDTMFHSAVSPKEPSPSASTLSLNRTLYELVFTCSRVVAAPLLLSTHLFSPEIPFPLKVAGIVSMGISTLQFALIIDTSPNNSRENNRKAEDIGNSAGKAKVIKEMNNDVGNGTAGPGSLRQDA